MASILIAGYTHNKPTNSNISILVYIVIFTPCCVRDLFNVCAVAIKLIYFAQFHQMCILFCSRSLLCLFVVFKVAHFTGQSSWKFDWILYSSKIHIFVYYWLDARHRQSMRLNNVLGENRTEKFGGNIFVGIRLWFWLRFRLLVSIKHNILNHEHYFISLIRSLELKIQFDWVIYVYVLWCFGYNFYVRKKIVHPKCARYFGPDEINLNYLH